jgi:hypothetical protein
VNPLSDTSGGLPADGSGIDGNTSAWEDSQLANADHVIGHVLGSSIGATDSIESSMTAEV